VPQSYLQLSAIYATLIHVQFIPQPYKDDFDEEAEARERYGFNVFCPYHVPDNAPPPVETTSETTPEEIPAVEPPDVAEQPREHNYHYDHALSEDHLPDLDFYRHDNVFSARPVNSWLNDASEQPEPRPLFGDLWYEGEMAILFAATAKGKSVLAVQIAESIATGTPIPPFSMEAEPQRVLLFDFELEDKQFEQRYAARVPLSNETVHYRFSDNFIRARVGYAEPPPGDRRSFTVRTIDSIVELIEYTRARVVIIDNITWLNTSLGNTSSALALVKGLKRLKLDLGLSILILAHTPKRYEGGRLGLNDMQGSKMLSNFADTIFALGGSRLGHDIRYLKHLKVRNAPTRADETTVWTLRLGKMHGVAPPELPLRGKHVQKVPGEAGGAAATYVFSPPSAPAPAARPVSPDAAFLGFTYAGMSNESDHLGPSHRIPRGRWRDFARILHSAGRTTTQIAHTLDLSPSTVESYLRKRQTSSK